MMKFSLEDIFSSIERVEDKIPVENLSSHIRFGEHKSMFKSEGHDFDQIREYDPEEDSIFEIIWNSVGSDKKLYVRKARATKEYTAVVMADLSASMSFGAGYPFKERMLLEVIGNVGLTCLHGQDPMGLIGFAEDVLFDETPRLGQDYIDYLIQEVYEFFKNVSSDSKGRLDRSKTDFEKVFRFFSEKYADNQCFLVVVSDFVGVGDFVDSQILKDVASNHEVVFIFLDDPTEFSIPRGPGYVEIEDMESGKCLEIRRRKLEALNLDVRRRRKLVRENLNNLGIDCMVLEYGKQFQRLSRIFMARQEAF